ncbi:MAG: hypothetical protein NC548_55205 [Lachnospiraceae bacterium]|nr:hypothetical protein [Lachnospiraceae bacterium]
MKDFVFYGKYVLMLALSVSLCACSLFSNMEVPEKVSVKTDARFSVALGKKTVDMNEIFGETLQNKISESVEGLDVFKYVPDKGDDTLQYLLHSNIYNFDLDIGEQLKGLNMDDMLSGADGIQVPEIKSPEPIQWDLPADKLQSPIAGEDEWTIGTKISLGKVGYINTAIIDKSGTIDIKVEKPAGTNGITLEMESLEISGMGLDFKKDNFVNMTQDGYLLFKRLDFSTLNEAQRTLDFSKGESIEIKGLITVNIAAGATCGGLNTRIEVNLKKIEKATADFSELVSFTKDENNGASRLPEDMLKYVTKVSFGEERGDTFYKRDKDGNSTNTKSEGLGIKCNIVNALPAGNDIDITMTSDVFNITTDDSKDWKISSYGNESSHSTSWAVFKEIDFSDTTKYDPENPPYMDFAILLSKNQELTNLEFGKEYAFSLKDAQFVFDWDSAEVKLDELSKDPIEGENDLSDLSRETLFGNLDGELGEFVKNIEFSDIMAYFYVQKPSDALDSLVGEIELTGKVEMTYTLDGQDKSEDILNAAEEFTLSSPMNWKANGSNEFATDLKTTDFIENYNMTKILNDDVKNLKIAYDLKISEGKGATVYKAALDSLDENDSTSISVDAAIVFPLELKIKEGATLDILELAEFDSDKKDLLDRESVDDMSDYEEYADYLEYIRLEYNLKNDIVKGLDFAIEVDDRPSAQGYTGINERFDFSEGNVDFSPEDAKKILTKFFMPKICLKFDEDTDITISRSGLASEESFSISPVFAIKLDGDSPICINDILNK